MAKPKGKQNPRDRVDAILGKGLDRIDAMLKGDEADYDKAISMAIKIGNYYKPVSAGKAGKAGSSGAPLGRGDENL